MTEVSFTRAARVALAIGAAIAAFALSTSAASAQAPPPTLTGETFAAGLFTTPPGLGSITLTSANCNPSGTSSLSYAVSGPAAGPYPGTFTETGTVEIGPEIYPGGFSNPNGLVTSWTVNYAINSPTGSVTGTKSLPPGTIGPGICFTASQSPIGVEQYSANEIPPGLAYDATIMFQGAQYGDHGRSSATFNDVPATPVSNNFNESFASEQPTTTPLCNQNSQTNQNQTLNQQGCANP